MDTRTNQLVIQEYGQPLAEDYGPPASARPTFGLWDIIDVLRREWRLPVIGLLIGLAVAVASVVVMKAPYKSSARILIDRSLNRYLQTNKIVDQPTMDEVEVGSQLYVLSSDRVMLPVIRSLNLASDSEFAGRSALASATDGSASTAAATAAAERAALEALLKRVTIAREDVANVINVTVESQSAEKAAKIANGIVDSYLASLQDAKLKSTQKVSGWLQERLIELKKQVADADKALQDFKTANNLSSTGAQDTELLASLNTQLMNAKFAAVEAKERLDRIKRTEANGIPSAVSTDALFNDKRAAVINFALNNSELARLRTQKRDLASRLAEMEARVGRKHAAVVKLRAQLNSIDAAIRSDEGRITDSYASEYEVAKARQTELEDTAAKLSAETGSRLRELESAAEALRNLYSGFLQKHKEIEAAQAETLPAQSAQIITRAVPPLTKSSKKTLIVAAGSIFLGLFLGIGSAFGREWMADVFRTPKAVEQVTETRCIGLPFVYAGQLPIEEHVLAAPFSRFTEGLRNVKAMLDRSSASTGGKVIGVVSAVSKEGKTVVAANLAALILSSSGSRTLLIDADLHLRNLTTALSPDAKVGLFDALEVPSRLDEFVCKRPHSGLDVLPNACTVRIPNAAELLGSQEMENLLAVARKSYDYIVVEVAPIMSVVDARLIERFIDEFVFVVECGQTKRTSVLEALSVTQLIRERVSTIVLNQIDPLELRTIEARNGVRSEGYYRE
ncbi:GumC family protein [Bradyrhizobium elkanii]|uniref:GumC family protein n=1 Tax=Bradyrhizobium elkanii TaxID=29448 RepID=UPI001BA9DFC3|nr:AAA family ATPase [Bradyrhizobium elkanii]MBR1159050.1 AAA family ATPase [Bradyrhizobium elkanii]